jgi:GNAT superfamily N-acetyltransferase
MIMISNQSTSLTKQEYKDGVELLRICEEHDNFGISTCINISMLQKADDGHHRLSSMYNSAFTVTPDKRGKGYGRAILEGIITLIKSSHPGATIR